MVTKSCTTSSPEQTREMAATIGERCRGGELLLLHGDLGSGKTCFTQGLARGLGVPADMRVTSPTFTLHVEYPGRLILNHLDLYRLDEPCALDSLGLDDILGDKQAVTAIEWPELMGPADGDRLEIRIQDVGEGKRVFTLTAYGNQAKALLD